MTKNNNKNREGNYDNKNTPYFNDKIMEDALIRAYRQRQLATEAERTVEDAIYDPEAHHSEREIEYLLLKYADAKHVREQASLHAAREFMLSSPAVRKKVDWHQFTPGHEKDPGRGNSPSKNAPTRGSMPRAGLYKMVDKNYEKCRYVLTCPDKGVAYILNPHDFRLRPQLDTSTSLKIVYAGAQERKDVALRPTALMIQNGWHTDQVMAGPSVPLCVARSTATDELSLKCWEQEARDVIKVVEQMIGHDLGMTIMAQPSYVERERR